MYTEAMSTAELLQRAKHRLDMLTPKRLEVAEDFLAYLEEREEDEATAELLALPGFGEALREAEAEVAAGQLTPVADLRRET
jgi:hypothetical protein